jgi:hypothetical protein
MFATVTGEQGRVDAGHDLYFNYTQAFALQLRKVMENPPHVSQKLLDTTFSVDIAMFYEQP